MPVTREETIWDWPRVLDPTGRKRRQGPLPATGRTGPTKPAVDACQPALRHWRSYRIKADKRVACRVGRVRGLMSAEMAAPEHEHEPGKPVD